MRQLADSKPAHNATASQRMTPFSVSTPTTLPRSVRMPVTPVCSNTSLHAGARLDERSAQVGWTDTPVVGRPYSPSTSSVFMSGQRSSPSREIEFARTPNSSASAS